MVKFLLLFFLISTSAHADTLTQIEAQDVDFDGKKVRLAGQVHVAHEFGDIYCTRAVLILTEGQKGFSPHRIILDGDVEVKLHDGSQINSEEADIDCKTLEGVFVAGDAKKVIYSTFVGDAKNKVPVKALSRAMKISLKKSENGSNYEISDVQAEGAVKVEYQNSLAGTGVTK